MGKPTSGGAGGSGGRQRAEPAPETPPPPPARNITVSGEGLGDLQTLIGRRKKLSADEVGDMIGAPDGSTITVTAEAGTIYMEVKHPNVTDMLRELSRIDGKLVLYNDSLMLKPDAPKGMGTAIVTRQVEAARTMGIGKIDLFAGGFLGWENMNGYYTWPRVGFDAPIPSEKASNIPIKIKQKMKSETMLELYRTQAGRDWWLANGGGVSLSFDTDPNSKSSQTLDSYNEERRKRSG